MTTGVLRASTERRFKAGLGLAHIAFSDPLNVVAFALLALIVLMAVFGPYVVPYDPLRSSALEALLPPSTAHWFGTDDLGRDVFSRVVVAARLDMLISVSAVALSLVAGSAIGLLAGYYGGWFDRISGRVIDTIMAFPLFVLAMGIVAAAGNTVANVVYATAIINLPFYARLVRAETLTRRDAGFVQAARLCGNPDWRILIFHIFPNVLPPLMITVSLNMGWSIMNAAGLSFIGLGVQPPTAEWGILVAQGANYIISGEWWIALFPGAVLMLAVFTFNLLGDVLRDLVDPLRRVTLTRRDAGFVQAARLCGNPDWRILLFHIFPNVLPPLMITVSLNMGWSIMNAAGLSFIGLGVQPPTPEWGILVAQGANYIISGEWWIALFPGAVLMLAVFTFNLLGDVLRDLVDPLRRV